MTYTNHEIRQDILLELMDIDTQKHLISLFGKADFKDFKFNLIKEDLISELDLEAYFITYPDGNITGLCEDIFSMVLSGETSWQTYIDEYGVEN